MSSSEDKKWEEEWKQIIPKKRVLLPEPEAVATRIAKARRVTFIFPAEELGGRVQVTALMDPTEPETDTVTLQSVVVTIEVQRTSGGRPWPQSYYYTFIHDDLMKFESLLAHKKAQGFVVAADDAVLAYMLIWSGDEPSRIGVGLKSLITGFLRTYPQFANVSLKTVGSALSRFAKSGLIKVAPRVELPFKEGFAPPLLPEETRYAIVPEVRSEKLMRSRWWREEKSLPAPAVGEQYLPMGELPAMTQEEMELKKSKRRIKSLEDFLRRE